MNTGEKIKKYRNLKVLTQAELGSMVGITGDMIRKYENNVRTLKADRLKKIADALNVNTTQLIGFDIKNISFAEELLRDIIEEHGKSFIQTFLENEE